jgi:hypothetical protein
MTTAERRMAARANQRAAAFIRFHLLAVLHDASEDETSRLAFVTALASIAGSIATSTLGRERALDHLQTVAETSAQLSDADDIDRYFED